MKLFLKQYSCLLFLINNTANADIFHYNNIIIGDRAMGLGGAYSAIADDSSGLVYNPAGIAFAAMSDISGSANAYSIKETVYKKVLGGDNFTERSEGFFPSFFGGIQKLDKYSSGLVAGFAMYTPDSDYRDQNDKIRKVSSGVESFHRTVNLRSTTTHLLPGVGYRVSSNFSVGFSLGYLKVDELIQEFQHSVLALPALSYVKIADSSKSKGDIYFVQANNVRYKLAINGIEPAFGTQYVIGSSFVVGLYARIPFLITQKFDWEGDRTSAYRFTDFSVVTADDLDMTGLTTEQQEYLKAGIASGKVTTVNPFGLKGTSKFIFNYTKVFENWPWTVRGGFAWFISPKLLWAADAEYNSEAKGANSLTIFDRNAVINYSTGIEYYVIPSMPIRIGGFTNYDTRPEVTANEAALQIEHIDYYGGTCFLTWAEPSSQIGLGVVYQLGFGSSKKIDNSNTVQDVESKSITVGINVAHQL